MQLASFVMGPIRSNCYVLAQDPGDGKDAVVIDPGDTELEPVFAYIDEHQLRVVAVWNTHAHFDHVMGVDLVRTRYNVPAYVNEADLPIWNGVAQATLEMFERQVPELGAPNGYLTDGQQLTLGAEKFVVWHTPGHSPGSICLIGETLAFTGDTLFAGTIGATHFFLGSPQAMETSLQRLQKLPDELAIYPGHGQPSTIGQERQSNPYLLG